MRAAVDRRVRHRLVPIHPEPVTGHPDLMDWVFPPGTFHAAGRVLRAPGEFGQMLAGGPVASAVVQPGGGQLLVRLRPGATWRQVGGRVRSALHAALERPDDWTIGGATPADQTDRLLRAAASSVLNGEFGEYVRSHGGRVELLDVTDGVVSIRFHGACHGCPAVGITAHKRFERSVRARCPMLVSVRCR